jgi:signal peptidase I
MILPGRELMPVIRAALDRGQRVRMTVTGSSMLPFLRDNDVVELEPASVPRLGDMVLVQTAAPGAAERYVLHRVARMDGAAFFIRGDAQPHCEGPFTSDAVLGRVTTAWHNGRPRVLDRGVWRLAGLMWMRYVPFGLRLFWLAARLRGVGSRVIRTLQRLSVFRAWVKRSRPAYAIQEASQSDLMALYARLNPDGEYALPPSERNANPNLTNYVAKSESEVLGLVRLMRHPETDFPHIGHWLYSLTVKTRYRGMGVGAALTQRVIDQSRFEGVAELFLEVFEDNVPAIALYRNLGFEPATLPALEAERANDVQLYGRRRVPLRKPLR